MKRRTAVAANPNDPDALDWGRIFPVFVIVLVDLLGLSIIIPVLPLYAASYGANAFVIGLLAAAYPIMQFIFAPILGRLSDRYGRKPVLLISQLGTFAGFVLLGFANSLAMLFVSRIIDGISGGNISTAQAVITDSTTERNRTQALGLIGAAFGLGFTIGPVIAFIVLAATGNNYQAVAFTAAGFSLISIVLTAVWLKESLPADKRGQTRKPLVSRGALGKALRTPQVGFLLMLMFMQQFVFGGLEYLLPLFTLSRLGMGAAWNAVLFVFIGIIAVVVLGGLLGRWSRARGDKWIILLGISMLAAGMILVALTPMIPPPTYSKTGMTVELRQGADRAVTTQQQAELNVDLPPDGTSGLLGIVWIFAAMVPVAIGGSVLGPTINSAITKRTEPVEVGGMLGMSASMNSLANAITPIIGGLLFQFFGSTIAFLLGGFAMIGLYFLAQRQLKPMTQLTPQPAA